MPTSQYSAFHGKSYGFGLAAFRRHPAITPIVVIISGVVVFVSSWCAYAMATKMDVQVDNKTRRYEKIDLSNPTYPKLFNIGQEVHPMPDLQQLLKEINEADRK